jgi:hypothetical protein
LALFPAEQVPSVRVLVADDHDLVRRGFHSSSASEDFQMPVERRGAKRYNFGAIAEFIDIDRLHELVSVTRDLSLSGCFARTTTPFTRGTRVRVRITHSGADFAAIGNVTANVTETGMGILFTEMEHNDQAILERWLGFGGEGLPNQ